MSVDTWEDGAREALYEISNTLMRHRGTKVEFARDTMRDLRDDYSTLAYRWDGRYALDQLQFGYDEIVAILSDKQRKYGPDNILGFGHRGIQMRMHDKCARILNCDKFDVTDDENPFFDFLGYCVVGIMLERGWFELPLGADAPSPASQDGPLTNAEWMARGEFDDPDEDPFDWGWSEMPPAGTDLFPDPEPVYEEPVATYIPTFVAYWDGNYQMMSYTWSGDKITVEYQRLP
jgi:hypothetical protein